MLVAAVRPICSIRSTVPGSHAHILVGMRAARLFALTVTLSHWERVVTALRAGNLP